MQSGAGIGGKSIVQGKDKPEGGDDGLSFPGIGDTSTGTVLCGCEVRAAFDSGWNNVLAPWSIVI